MIAHSSQVGCKERNKEEFWHEVMQVLPNNLDAVIGGDIKININSERGEYERVHGQCAF